MNNTDLAPGATVSVGSVNLPLVGFGTYLIPQDQAQAAVRSAVQAGYRHIDTAEFYANEAGVGAGIRQATSELGIDPAEVVVTTKLFPGNAAWGQTPKTTATTIDSLNRSLDLLGTDSVDLYLIHAPFERKQRLAQWEGMVALKEQGKARAIGVSNFNINHLEEIRESGMPMPEANQIELHPWSRKPELVDYLRANGITPIAYSSLVPLATWRIAPGHDSGKTDAMRESALHEDSPFRIIAEKHGVSEAQVLLRWAVQQGIPVLPKSLKEDRMRQNADLFGFRLDDEDMRRLNSVDKGDGVAWGAHDPTRNA